MYRNQHRELRKMKKKRNISPKKEQDKSTKIYLNETEISNLPDREFKIIVIKLVT